MKLLTDEQLKSIPICTADVSDCGTCGAGCRDIAQAQLASCEAELQAERERIIETIEEFITDYCGLIKGDGNWKNLIVWQSLEVRIRNGL